MTEENKQLLIKDLCARLPYGVKCNCEDFDKPMQLVSMFPTYDVQVRCTWQNISTFYYLRKKVEQIKPYLYPLSSMTEEQCKEFNDLSDWVEVCTIEDECIDSSVTVVKCRELVDQYGEVVSASTSLGDYIPCIEWLNKNHFDYRGLIEKKLAIDCTNLNIY